MITSIVTFAAVLLFVGTISIGFRKGDSTFKEIVPTAIAAGSLVILGYIVLSFRSLGEIPDKIIMNWQLPSAKFIAGIDPLTGFFMIPLMILSATCALYGKKYFVGHPAGRMHWFNYSLLVAGMVMVLVSRNAIMFILSWEIMAVSSFFLVITDTANPVTLRSGWIYFITAHIGTAFLFALFFLFSSTTGSTDFSVWKDAGFVGMSADLIFIFALIAFGLKAGFIPFHVWLPLAHPAAPSHISALMSGIMIKMGIYGILRILSFITPYHAWWGILLIGIGAVSGLLGVLFAIGQHDIKQLLAYHSVENIGIILLGIGVGIIGVVYNSPMVALFGFAGGLLHIVNHSLFKGLLFLGAGAVIRQTGTGKIDCLGGLIKTMPRTAFLFLIGATAICGLPFFNGFISELMIYTGSIEGAVDASKPVFSLLCLIVVLSLALIGGLAAACFTKIFGIVFLGEPRSHSACVKDDVPVLMIVSMGFLALLCLVTGMCSPLIIPFLVEPVSVFFAIPSIADTTAVLHIFTLKISIILGVCVIVAVIVAIIRARVGRKDTAETGTWDCGYSLPDPSMQYTASSFAAPVVNYFKRPLAANNETSVSTDYLPESNWHFHSSVNDWFMTKLFAPVFQWSNKMFGSLRWFQNGKSGQYVLYIFCTVLGLIIWKFFL